MLDRELIPMEQIIRERKERKVKQALGAALSDSRFRYCWVAYKWNAKKERWDLLGFWGGVHIRRRQLQQIRDRFRVRKNEILQLLPLHYAAQVKGPQKPAPWYTGAVVVTER